MKSLILLGFVALLSTAPARAASDAESQKIFDEAGKSYESGDNEKALEGYTGLVRRGFGGVDLFYNLANVHYRRGERGRAVLWYERAARLAPRDSDVRFNLSLARSHIKSDSENIVRRGLTYFSENELAVAVSVFSAMFFGLVGLLTLGKLKGDTWPALSVIVTGTLFTLSAGWMGARLYLDRRPQAVVVAPPGEVRNGPGTDYAVGFTIPEGSRVLILTRRPEWTQVGVPEQGLKGWMPTAEIEAISTSQVPS